MDADERFVLVMLAISEFPILDQIPTWWLTTDFVEFSKSG